MKGVAQLFERFLHSKNLRLTKQRELILKAIYATHAHISADDLYDDLLKKNKADELRISRATVYRTLTLLTEGGFIQVLDIGLDLGLEDEKKRDKTSKDNSKEKKARLYEHVMGHSHHDHMKCLECGRIFEFHDAELEAVQTRAVEKLGFKATSHRLNIFGTCKACLAAAKRHEARNAASGA